MTVKTVQGCLDMALMVNFGRAMGFFRTLAATF